MGHHQVYIGSVHPLGKAVGHSLWQRTAVGSPGEHHLRTLRLAVLVDGDEVGKGLERMHRGSLHSHNGAAAVAHKLVDDGLGIVEVTVFEPGK